jgi:hypothetical protein
MVSRDCISKLLGFFLSGTDKFRDKFMRHSHLDPLSMRIRILARAIKRVLHHSPLHPLVMRDHAHVPRPTPS